MEVAASAASRTMTVGLPKAVIGFKEVANDRSRKALIEREISSDFLVEAVFGWGSRNFRILYEEGLVDDSFFAVAGVYPEIGFVSVGGDTPKPRMLLNRLKEMARKSAEDLTEEQFVRVKRKFVGEFIKRFNTVELLGSSCVSYMVNDLTLKDIWEALNEIDLRSLRKRASQLFEASPCSEAVILPHNWEGERAEG